VLLPVLRLKCLIAVRDALVSVVLCALRLACNDVYAMLTTYGVEAARATILKEVQVS